MKLYSVYDPEFKAYGQLPSGYDVSELLAAMARIPLPAQGVAYEPSIASLEACGVFSDLRDRGYGGMPVQLGMCWGRNTKLNCLEYHRDSEINIGTGDFILLLARQEEIERPSASPRAWSWRSTPRRCTTRPATPTRRPAFAWRWSCPAAQTRQSPISRRAATRTP